MTEKTKLFAALSKVKATICSYIPYLSKRWLQSSSGIKRHINLKDVTVTGLANEDVHKEVLGRTSQIEKEFNENIGFIESKEMIKIILILKEKL